LESYKSEEIEFVKTNDSIRKTKKERTNKQTKDKKSSNCKQMLYKEDTGAL